MKLEMLFNLTKKEDIIIEYVDFSPTIQGLYYKADGCPPIIGINENIVSNKKLFTCVLAEELGHHFTSIGDTTAEYYSFTDRINLNKTELIALKWATEYLLPLNEIINAIKKGITNMKELSDFLNVTDEFLLEKFKFIAKKQSYIKIQGNLFIALTNLPNVYLYENYHRNRKDDNIRENNNTLVAECGRKYNI